MYVIILPNLSEEWNKISLTVQQIRSQNLCKSCVWQNNENNNPSHNTNTSDDGPASYQNLCFLCSRIFSFLVTLSFGGESMSLFLLLFDSPLRMFNIRCPITFVSFLYTGSGLDTPQAGEVSTHQRCTHLWCERDSLLAAAPNPELDH